MKNRPGVGYEGHETESKNNIGIPENIFRKKGRAVPPGKEPPIFWDMNFG